MARMLRLFPTLALLALLVPPATLPAAAQDEEVPGVLEEPVLYHLPAPAGTSLYVIQGPDTGALGGDHLDAALFAYDLSGPAGEPFAVAAVRAGIVAAVRSDVPDGACPGADLLPRPPCWSEANHVVIDHLDGTAALYLHLAQGSSATLAPGTPVAQGQLLGLSGSSGTAGPARLHLMLMSGAAAAGDPDWWRTSLPLAFADAAVLALHPDGVPGTGLDPEGPFVSDNPGPGGEPPIAGEPVARPPELPARLPWRAGAWRMVASGEELHTPDPGGVAFEVLGPRPDRGASEDDEAYPLFGGRLLYAGCAAGAAAQLGRVVIIEREAAGHTWQALHAHLSSLDPYLEAAMAAAAGGGEAVLVAPDAPIGTFGSSTGAPDGSCDVSDGGPVRLRVMLLRDALAGPGGSLSGGTPVYPWPINGSGAYEPLAWWSGPMRALDPVPETGAPPRGEWADQGTPDRAHVAYGAPVVLSLRVRGGDLREVRFMAHHADWPARRSPARYRGLDPDTTWRLLAVCRPKGTGGQPRTSAGCRWQGDGRSAVVSYTWYPALAEEEPLVPWQPPARAAVTLDAECSPVTFAYDVADAAGRRLYPDPGRIAPRCDPGGTRVGHMVNLDPLTPPAAPSNVRLLCMAEGTFGCDEYDLTWRDNSSNEQGFRIYAQDANVCREGGSGSSMRRGPWLVATVKAGTQKWDVALWEAVEKIEKSLGAKYHALEFWLSVSAYNAAGSSNRIKADHYVSAYVDVAPC